MRYIRTKDKIIDAKKQAKKYGMTLEEYFKAFPFANSEKANTIEELCDEFVAIYKDENKSARVLETFGDYRQLDEKQLIYNIKNGWNIFGAIWTNKGLIYVAKMNDKGELELL